MILLLKQKLELINNPTETNQLLNEPLLELLNEESDNVKLKKIIIKKDDPKLNINNNNNNSKAFFFGKKNLRIEMKILRKTLYLKTLWCSLHAKAEILNTYGRYTFLLAILR